jgi:hypothetical protein
MLHLKVKLHMHVGDKANTLAYFATTSNDKRYFFIKLAPG